MGASTRLVSDWDKIKSLKLLNVRGRDTNKVSRAARTLIPLCDELAEVLERDHTVAHCLVQCTTSGLVCCDKQGVGRDTNEAASFQELFCCPA